MRRARGNGLLKDDDGQLIGINLGADYVSEHEWGIKGLRQMFGVRDEGYGIDKRIMTKMPKGTEWSGPERYWVKLVEKRNKITLLVGQHCTQDAQDLKYLELGDYSKEKLSTSWDEGSFGIEAYSKEDRLAVKEIYKAIENHDLAMWLGGGGVFENAGLVLAIASRLPQDKIKILKDADLDREKLEKAVLETGIVQKLALAGKKYYALHPQWKEPTHNGDNLFSNYNVAFFLNPYDQANYNHGWYLVEELEQWIDGKGPIPKTAEQKRK